MPIIFKLIGCGSSSPIELKKDIVGNIKLNDMESIFPILDSSDIPNIRFIANKVPMTSDTLIEINSEELLVIYIFTNILDIQNKLLKIFIKEELPSVKNTDIEEERKNPILDDETVLKINKKTIELFSNPNFRKLLDIWQNDPNVFSDFFPYINKGNIVNIDIPENSKDKMFDEEIKHLNELGINKNSDILRDCLRKYNGNLNFTIREILAESKS